MPARGYEFYLRVLKSISHEWAQVFCLLYKHNNNDVFDDFPKIPNHYPKISEDFPNCSEG